MISGVPQPSWIERQYDKVVMFWDKTVDRLDEARSIQLRASGYDFGRLRALPSIIAMLVFLLAWGCVAHYLDRFLEGLVGSGPRTAAVVITLFLGWFGTMMWFGGRAMAREYQKNWDRRAETDGAQK